MNITAIETKTKTAAYNVGLANKMLSATAVHVLVINVDAMSILPISLFDRLVSTKTE